MALAYASVQAPMMAAMLRSRATVSRLLLSPVVAAPVTAVAGIGATGPVLTAGCRICALGLVHLAAAGTLYAGIGYLTGRSMARAPAAARTGWYQRGAIVAQADQRSTPRGPRVGPQCTQALTLAGQPVSAADETKHFKFIGTTGTGKSTAIAQLVGGALARGDSAVIADSEGGYLRRFYDADRGDVILNPFDQRSVKWDLFAEIRHGYDVEQIARSLLPDHGAPIAAGAVMPALSLRPSRVRRTPRECAT